MRKEDKVTVILCSVFCGSAVYGIYRLIATEVQNPEWKHYWRGASTVALLALIAILAFALWNMIDTY